jgi:hypothetical protein
MGKELFGRGMGKKMKGGVLHGIAERFTNRVSNYFNPVASTAYLPEGMTPEDIPRLIYEENRSHAETIQRYKNNIESHENEMRRHRGADREPFLRMIREEKEAISQERLAHTQRKSSLRQMQRGRRVGVGGDPQPPQPEIANPMTDIAAMQSLYPRAHARSTAMGLGRLKKGSKEAKEHMARIRGMKGKSKGGKIPSPPSRSPITDPSLL